MQNFHISISVRLTLEVPTLKMVKHTQAIRRQQPTNFLSVFDYFLGFALKGLSCCINLEKLSIRIFYKVFHQIRLGLCAYNLWYLINCQKFFAYYLLFLSKITSWKNQEKPIVSTHITTMSTWIIFSIKKKHSWQRDTKY